MPAFPLPSHRVATVSPWPWYERLPVRSRQIIVVTAAGFVALLLIVLVAMWYHRSRPIYVLEVLDRVNSPADVQAEQDYLTPQGKDILLWLLEKRSDKPASAERLVASPAIVTGDQCDVTITQGKMKYAVRLVRTDHWRFHDLYVEEINGRKVDAWASYIKDHPLIFALKTYWPEFLVGVRAGILIGAALGL